MCYSRRLAGTSIRPWLILTVFVFAVFCHEMGFTASALRAKLARAAVRKRAMAKPAVKVAQRAVKREAEGKKLSAYPKSFFPSSLLAESNGVYEHGGN